MEKEQNHPVQFGKYQILEELGRGGFGIVYHAFDTVLEVERAIKELYPNLVNDPSFVSRFRQEARIAAKLDHPNLVSVYDFGQIGGKYYLAMGYMSGGSLKELIKREGPLSKERALEILEQVGAGLSYLHRKGVVHRDLKPGNILFDNEGQARVSDMGFAKLARGTSGMSMSASGGLVGTPAYIAPEIWRGKAASASSDVYSLACILVEILTGRVLFDGDSTPEVMFKHFEPLRLPEGLPGEWRPAIEKALEKESASRFEDVLDFVKALRAVDEKPSIPVIETKQQETTDFPKRTTDEAESLPTPVEASQQSQQAKEPTRHDWAENEKGHDGVPALIKPKAPKGKVPAYVGLAVLALLVVFLLIRAGIFVGPQKDTGLPPAEVTSQPAETNISTSTLKSTITSTKTMAPSLTPTRTLQPTVMMTPTLISLLGSTVVTSSNANQVELLTWLGEGEASTIAYSPDGKTLSSGNVDRSIFIWDTGSGNQLRTLIGKGIVWSVAWSPDGKTLASGGYGGTIILWDVGSGSQLRTLEGHTDVVYSVAWSPDGKTLASGNYDSIILLWDMENGTKLRTLEGHKSSIMSVAWSPDGKTLASGGYRSIILWDAGSGSQLRTLEGHTNWVRSVAWSSDGKTLASGSEDGTIILWDANSGSQLRTLKGDTVSVTSVAWSPDGKILATGGSGENTIILWDAGSGSRLRTLEGHTNAVMSVAWSPNGKTLASGSWDGTICFWGIP